MYGVLAKGGSLSQAMVAVSQAVPNTMRPIIPAVLLEAAEVVHPVSRQKVSKPLTFTYTNASTSIAGKYISYLVYRFFI